MQECRVLGACRLRVIADAEQVRPVEAAQDVSRPRQGTEMELVSTAHDWVMCDECSKWRRISHELAQSLEADASW